MNFKIPFSILPSTALKKGSHIFLGVAKRLERGLPFLKQKLKQARIDVTPQDYISRCLLSTVSFFFFMCFFIILIILLLGLKGIFLAFMISSFLSLFVFLQQIVYPILLANRKIKGVEKNILSVLQSILVQLNSGIPLFNIFVNIASSDYGEISLEFKKAVKRINAGTPQVVVLEELANENPSLYFRRAIWQLTNGMKSGSDISNVVKEIISALSEEQITQIQNYGSQLNPLAMFYMLIAVILPSLGITFLIVMSSFISLSEAMTKMIFWGLYGAVAFFQIMFIGLIKSRRPSLLND